MNPILRWVESPPPEVTVAEAEQLALNEFGVAAAAVPLYAERDRNFRLDADNGHTSILKISNRDISREIVAFQVRALVHIAHTDPDLKVPRIMRSLQGEQIVTWRHPGGQQLLVRMLNWLDGECIDFTDAPAAAAFSAGRYLARLGRALASCSPSGSPRDLPWDLANTPDLRGLAGFIDDPVLLELVNDLFHRFDTELLPAFNGLRRQVIHNDLNPGNLLFDPRGDYRVSGVIDFGDMTEDPLIFDLAVACAYQLGNGPDPVGDLLPMIRGYHQVNRLQDPEIEVLVPLVECRLLATLLIQGSRVAESGQGENDLFGVACVASDRLKALAGVSHATAVERIRAACA